MSRDEDRHDGFDKEGKTVHYFPISLTFIFILLLLFIFLVALIELRVLQYAYEKVGVRRQYAFLLLLLSLMGSYFNIPVYQLPPEQMVSSTHVDFFGMRYIIPMVHDTPGTLITVNVGGAVIPLLLSLYLLIKNKLYARGLLAIAIIAGVVHLLAYPVRGVGIAEPVFVPIAVAAPVAIFLSRARAPALAYIGGSLGTLIGADLWNLGKLQGLGAPIASIGGAGTFDGIFLTGILAVLLASLLGSRRPHTSS
jgi:uncharacterized membrane protein